MSYMPAPLKVTYREDRATLLQLRSVQAVDDDKWSVYTAWEMSLEKLSSSTAMLLRLFAFLYHDGISRAVFENAAAFEDTTDAFHDGIHFLANFRTKSGEWSIQSTLTMYVTHTRSMPLFMHRHANGSPSQNAKKLGCICCNSWHSPSPPVKTWKVFHSVGNFFLTLIRLALEALT
jgi:hypothetical protein